MMFNKMIDFWKITITFLLLAGGYTTALLVMMNFIRKIM